MKINRLIWDADRGLFVGRNKKHGEITVTAAVVGAKYFEVFGWWLTERADAAYWLIHANEAAKRTALRVSNYTQRVGREGIAASAPTDN